MSRSCCSISAHPLLLPLLLPTLSASQVVHVSGVVRGMPHSLQTSALPMPSPLHPHCLSY
eukprot:7249184-Prorocentrum_lima.AAC.1